MAELDARIYGELQIPEVRTMEQRAAGQAARETAELNREIARQKQSEIARASQANAALRQAMARFPNDPQKSMLWLTENGYGDVAMEMTEAIGKAGKAAEDSREQKLKADRAQWEQIYAVTRLMGNPQSYGMGRSMILATDPGLAQFLPESWEQGGESALKPFDTFLLSAKDKMDAETTRRGQDITAGTAMRGQDMTQQTALRGQDVTAETAAAGQGVTMRGQDIGAQTAKAGQAVTMRGQDIAASTAIRGQDLVNARVGAGSGRPPTMSQNRAMNFFNRAKQADEDLEPVEEGIAKSGTAAQYYREWAPNFMQSGAAQQYTQAQRAFTEARLRKDSGAAIPEHEFTNDRQTYFVQPGDKPETIANKRRARAAMIASIGSEAGSALDVFYGDDAPAILEGYKSRMKREAAGGGGPKEGDTKPITASGYPPGSMATFRNGEWVRTK